MKSIEIKAPAKINIGLNILSKRKDGYHNLSTLFYPILDLFDTLLIRHSNSFSFECQSKNIPVDESNLVVKAVRILEREIGKYLSVRIELIKRIPSQAGLGGGSSDAAAVLISLNEFFKLGISYRRLLELALELGSDVPFFLKAKPAIGTLRGDFLEPVDLYIQDAILIINPNINISTKEAFANIVPNNVDVDFASLIVDQKLNYSQASAILKNDFEEYAFSKYPQLKWIKTLLYNSGAKFSMMSGSGSTMYGIFSDLEKCKKAAQLIPKEYFVFTSTPHM